MVINCAVYRYKTHKRNNHRRICQTCFPVLEKMNESQLFLLRSSLAGHGILSAYIDSHRCKSSSESTAPKKNSVCYHENHRLFLKLIHGRHQGHRKGQHEQISNIKPKQFLSFSW